MLKTSNELKQKELKIPKKDLIYCIKKINNMKILQNKKHGRKRSKNTSTRRI